MTPSDKILIEKANQISRLDYYLVDELIARAQSAECIERLRWIRYELYDLAIETI